MDSSRRSSSRRDATPGPSRETSNRPRPLDFSRPSSYREHNTRDAVQTSAGYQERQTYDGIDQVGSGSGYDRAYYARNAAQVSSSNLERSPKWRIGMGGEPPVTEFYTPEVPSQEPTDNGRYLDAWNIRPSKRYWRYTTAAGRYAQETIEKNRYQSAVRYSSKHKKGISIEITPEERLDNLRYRVLIRDYNGKTETGKYARETIGENRYQSALQYDSKTRDGRYTEVTPQEVEDNSEYKRLLRSHREGGEMINEYTQE